MTDLAVERWHSTRMQRDITVTRWGHYGTPVLVFPTAGGDAHEIERMGLIDRCRDLLDAGRVKIYSCDSIAGQAMMRRDGSPEHLMWLFNQFHEAVAHEVVAAIHTDTHSDAPVLVAGSSIGAFNSLAMVCRYPWLFSSAICMSGSYRIEHLVGGTATQDFYFSSPMHFLPGLHGEQLDQARRRFVVLASGTGDYEDLGESWAAAHALGAKGIPNRVDDWGPGYAHDWPTWWEMLPAYLAELA